MTASEYRRQGREALRGRWGTGVAICLIAALLMGGLVPVAGGGSTGGAQLGLQEMAQIGNIMRMITVIGFAMTVAAFVLGGAVEIGKAGCFLKLAEGQQVKVRMLFDHIHRIGAGMALYWLRLLLMLVWMLPGLAVSVGGLLLTMNPEAVAPVILGSVASLGLGLMASFRYAMAPYLMAQDEHLGAWNALKLSKERMHGWKWRLCCLKLSFIGWTFLCLFTYGIGELWVQPYMGGWEGCLLRERIRNK